MVTVSNQLAEQLASSARNDASAQAKKIDESFTTAEYVSLAVLALVAVVTLLLSIWFARKNALEAKDLADAEARNNEIALAKSKRMAELKDSIERC